MPVNHAPFIINLGHKADNLYAFASFSGPEEGVQCRICFWKSGQLSAYPITPACFVKLNTKSTFGII
jgi:hypothetical protein